MVFDKYNFPFNPDSDDNPSIDHHSDESDLLKDSTKDISLLEDGECIGPACCDRGMIYDNQKQLCVVFDSKKSEAFISGQSTQMPGADLNDETTISKKLISYDNSGKYYSM